MLHGWRSKQPEKDTDYAWLRGQASRAKAALERAGELADRLGDGAPEMDAGALHPWAWDNGSSYWRTGHYHQAVLQAAIGVNAETQAKVGRTDVSEIDLFNQVFTLDAAKPGAPRLRLMADDGSKTYESLHRGARAFAEGVYAAIRNPGMHQPFESGEEHIALEQLAAISILARWVDEAKLEREGVARPARSRACERGLARARCDEVWSTTARRNCPPSAVAEPGGCSTLLQLGVAQSEAPLLPQ